MNYRKQVHAAGAECPKGPIAALTGNGWLPSVLRTSPQS
jgi:hypothetical protein